MKKSVLRAACALFAGLLVAGASFSPAAAHWRRVLHGSDSDGKGRMLASEVDEGMKVVFDIAFASLFDKDNPESTMEGTLYGDPSINWNGVTAATLDLLPSTANQDNEVWEFEYYDNCTSMVYSGQPMYLLKNVGTGMYVGVRGGNGPGSTGTARQGRTILSSERVIEQDQLILVDERSDAMPFIFTSCIGTFGGNLWGDRPHFGSYANNTAIVINPNNQDYSDGSQKLSIEFEPNLSVYFYTSGAEVLRGFGTDRYRPGQGMMANRWGSTRAWDMYEVQMVSGSEWLQAALAEYTAAGRTPANLQGGTAPGYYDPEAAEAFAQAWTAITDAIAGGATLSDDDVDQLTDNLASTYTAVAATRVPVTEGYYFITSGSDSTLAMKGGITLTSAAGLQWGTFDKSDPLFAFKLTTNGTGFDVQNVGTNYYVKSPGTASAASLQAGTAQTFAAISDTVGQFAMTTAGASTVYMIDNPVLGTGNVATTAATNATAGSAASWRLVPIDAATVATLQSASTQLQNDLALQRLISEADDRVAATDTVIQLDPDVYVADASQLSTNAPEPTEPDQTVGMAIDGDLNTYFHTRWSRYNEGEALPTEPHYLLADAGDDGFSGDVAFRAVRRRNADGSIFNNSWPVEAWITASNDSVTWDTITSVNLGDAGVSEYVSPIISLDQTYRYLKFSLIRHSQTAPNGNGQYAFCLAEFNWYAAQVSETRSASLREDTKQQLADLKAALAEARTVEHATDADVQKLQAALDAFNAVYPETGELEEEIINAQNLLDASPIQDGAQGYYNTADAGKLQAAMQAANAGDLEALTKAEIDSRLANLQQAEVTFRWSFNVADSNKVYYIKSVHRGTWAVNGVLYADAANTEPNTPLHATVGDSIANDAHFYWHVARLNDSVYTLQNVATGWYLEIPDLRISKNNYTCRAGEFNDLARVKFQRFTNGAFDILPEYDTRDWLHLEGGSASTSNLVTVNPYVTSPMETFTLIEVSNPKAFATKQVNDLCIMTLPFNTKKVPTPTDGSLAYAYTVVGFIKDATTNEVTYVRLGVLDENTPIKAGQPFILETGRFESFDAGDVKTLELNLQFDDDNIVMNNQPAASDANNGLCGVLKSQSVAGGQGSALIYFSNAQALPINGSARISAQTGYINLNGITDVSDQYADVDIIDVPISGSVVGIERVATSKDGAPVNVYSIDGVLLRRAVPAHRATTGLPSGLYIVGGQKVLVK